MNKEKGFSKPVVFQYDSLKDYLQDVLDYFKSTDSSFTHRSFAEKAGIGSPSYFGMILKGQRKLGSNSIAKFSRGLELESDEAEYFDALARFDNSKDPDDRTLHYKRMLRLRGMQGVRLVSEDHYEFFSNWHHGAIRELVALDGFELDFEWIAKTLEPEISVREAKRSWELLERLELVKKERGRWRQADLVMETKGNVPLTAFSNYHEAMLNLAIRSITNVSSKERDISSVTVGIDRADFKQMCKDVQKFRQSLVRKYTQDKKQLNKIMQLNFQIFPLNK